ncbi:hypothetical protein GHT06_003837 [Daphnia sinensis]|uniref:Uncharacterized protein n=1 Tax=Daphnia sinensis TaxID=1820382 RepID=A0AAD5KDN5_9CRUS|nr:hypothetical protein GHT06_003837 [Daphnia sinensis]
MEQVRRKETLERIKQQRKQATAVNKQKVASIKKGTQSALAARKADKMAELKQQRQETNKRLSEFKKEERALKRMEAQARSKGAALDIEKKLVDNTIKANLAKLKNNSTVLQQELLMDADKTKAERINKSVDNLLERYEEEAKNVNPAKWDVGFEDLGEDKSAILQAQSKLAKEEYLVKKRKKQQKESLRDISDDVNFMKSLYQTPWLHGKALGYAAVHRIHQRKE